ncbi:hypothetical protein BVRB_002670 [Beta vulgaris subsp. vulgaris]|uniref:C2 domain-containing protein n=1 Tax=Beta vulgaris subsp. vulgaris TaxID=3555 RepID=A0A0J8B4E2_BETVV|nr:hypothetical protein BVRB_002670 [Beta vulgaris subsp. vulgaris]
MESINHSRQNNMDAWVVEFTLLSGQSLTPPTWTACLNLLGQRMRAYAVVWIHEDAKFFTRIDEIGGSQPFWNHKFLFKVDNKFLSDKNQRINIAVYAAGAGLMGDDILIGTSNLKVNISNVTHMDHYEVRRYKTGVPLVQGLIHVKSNLVPYREFYNTINTVFDEALQDRLSIMSLDAQHQITPKLRFRSSVHCSFVYLNFLLFLTLVFLLILVLHIPVKPSHI